MLSTLSPRLFVPCTNSSFDLRTSPDSLKVVTTSGSFATASTRKPATSIVASSGTVSPSTWHLAYSRLERTSWPAALAAFSSEPLKMPWSSSHTLKRIEHASYL